MSPGTVSLIRFLVSVLVLNPESKVIYTAESGSVLLLYLPQNIREAKLSLPQFIG